MCMGLEVRKKCIAMAFDWVLLYIPLRLELISIAMYHENYNPCVLSSLTKL